MNITRVELHPVEVARAYTTQIARDGGGARDEVARSSFVLLEATTDSGLTGWGEISDIPLTERVPLERLAETVRGMLVGRDPFEIRRLHADYRAKYPVTFLEDAELPRLICAALDTVCCDLQSQAAGVPIHQLLGGRQRERVEISWVAFIRDDLEALREEIASRTAAGFRHFKLKVGIDIDLDEQRLAIVREEAGPHATIKLDANGGWNADEARRHIPRLQKYNPCGVETPIGGRDAQELARLRKDVSLPLLEHVATMEQALEYIRHDALDCFNIAVCSSGGITPAREIATVAETAGVGLLLGSTVELGLGTFAQLHLAGAISGLTMASDLVGPALYREDVVVPPLAYDDSCLAVPEFVGLGTAIDRQKLQQLQPE